MKKNNDWSINLYFHNLARFSYFPWYTFFSVLISEVYIFYYRITKAKNSTYQKWGLPCLFRLNSESIFFTIQRCFSKTKKHESLNFSASKITQISHDFSKLIIFNVFISLINILLFSFGKKTQTINAVSNTSFYNFTFITNISEFPRVLAIKFSIVKCW